ADLNPLARNVCFTNIPRPDIVAEVLADCLSMIDLAFYNVFLESPETLMSLLGAMRLQRLTIILSYLFPVPARKDFSHPLFANITHLAVPDWNEGGVETWAGLTGLRQLTHLSFCNMPMLQPLCEQELARCPVLEVLIAVFVHETTREVFVNNLNHAGLGSDPRFVTLVVADLTDDWEVGACGGEDYWYRAGALVTQRRSAAGMHISILNICSHFMSHVIQKVDS
ncbi:hypothetical protein C8R43DRAFT_897045, partial [Mycena crocata]